MADYNTIRVDQSGGVVTLTLNKPDKMNAMGPEMVSEMMSVYLVCLFIFKSINS